MSLSELTAAVGKLTRKDCLALSAALRARMCALAQAPDPVVARKVRTSSTASIVLAGQRYTGQIEDLMSRCLSLRFSDNSRLFLSMSDLDLEGFDCPLTASPDSLYSSEAVDPEQPVCQHDIRVLEGRLYRVVRHGDPMSECRRLRECPEIENFPSSYLKLLPAKASVSLEF